MRAGSVAELDIHLPGEEPLHLCGEVVRVEHSEERAGMAFRCVDETEKGRPLANFIMRQYQSVR